MQTATEFLSDIAHAGWPPGQVWTIASTHAHLERAGHAQSRRTTERLLAAQGLLPPELDAAALRDADGTPPNRLLIDWALAQAQRRRQRALFAQLYVLPGGALTLHANDARGARLWVALGSGDAPALAHALRLLQQFVGKPLVLLPHLELAARWHALTLPQDVSGCPQAYAPEPRGDAHPALARGGATAPLPPHLARLEAESIHILREAVAEAQRPAMLYSIGKDSSVMLHLARKAFHPAPPPFPLLHVDTRWKFREMYRFRDAVAREAGLELLVHVNPEAVQRDINPFDHGSALHTDITKTEGLKQALREHGFDMVFGGARRDEERSRAKERVFSLRSAAQRWDPKNQRPELWSLYNTRKNAGESFRVFPLSNWTELDIWQYIHHQGIPVVPLYFARPRAVVERAGMLMMVDDARLRLLPGEQIQIRQVRFRTLGCYPLTGAIDSSAATLDDILLELIHTRQSERQGRKIDTDSAGSMERKKQEGYF